MSYLGVDLGGTNIAVGLVDEEGKIVTKASTPTLNQRPVEEIVADMAKVCKKVVANANVSMDEVKAIGIGSPGTVDNKNGVIVYANNIKMKNVNTLNLNLVVSIRKHFVLMGCSVRICTVKRR